MRLPKASQKTQMAALHSRGRSLQFRADISRIGTDHVHFSFRLCCKVGKRPQHLSINGHDLQYLRWSSQVSWQSKVMCALDICSMWNSIFVGLAPVSIPVRRFYFCLPFSISRRSRTFCTHKWLNAIKLIPDRSQLFQKLFPLVIIQDWGPSIILLWSIDPLKCTTFCE